jgi:hypothetical protein
MMIKQWMAGLWGRVTRMPEFSAKIVIVFEDGREHEAILQFRARNRAMAIQVLRGIVCPQDRILWVDEVK